VKIEISALNSNISSYISDARVSVPVKNSQSNPVNEDVVEISKEAKQQKKLDKIHADFNKKEKAEKSGSGQGLAGDGASLVDAHIEKLKKQIKMVQQQIKKLEGNKSGAGKKMIEALRSQLMELNSALMEALNSKIADMES